MASVRHLLAFSAVLGLSNLISGAQSSDLGSLLNTTNVWSVSFRFAPDQWDAMPPEEPEGGMFGRPRPGGGGGGPGFGPGMFLSPVFMRAADSNQDKKMSREEMNQLASNWFTAWDKNKTGALKESDLRDGLNSVISSPAGGPPGINLQGREGKRNGLASAAGIEFKYVKGDLQIGDTKLRDVAVRYKGNGTWMGSRFDKKRSLKVDLNEFVKGQKYGEAAKLNFHNCVTDASYMNEVLSYQLYRDAGVPAPRTAYARVSVDVPGKHDNEYLGIYSVVENVDTAFTEDRFGSKKGLILKPVTRQPFEFMGEDWDAYNQAYDPKSEPSDKEKRRIIEFCKLVSQASDEEFAKRVGEYLDLDNFSRYMAVTAWLATLDSILGIGQNYYVYLHPKSNKLQFIPWDLDHSFGQFFLIGTQEQREQLSIQKPWQGQIRLLERVYKTEAFQKLYQTRLEEFTKTIFQPDRFVQQVDQVAAAIRSGVKDESESRFERFSKVAAGEPVPPATFGPPPGRGGPPGGGPGPGGFMQPAKPIKGFVKVRAESVKNQLSGKEQGSVVDGAFGGPGGRFGPGNFIAMGFVAQLDTDKNSEVSRDEFVGGLTRWFKDWDKAQTGSLGEEEVRGGLNETFRPPALGGRGGPGAPVVLPLGENQPRLRPPE